MEHLLGLFLGLRGASAYFAVFGVLLICGVGVPIPEDITLVAGGLLAYHGLANVYVMIIVGLAGVLVGDSLMFFLGHRYGRRLVEKSFIKRFITPESLDEWSLKHQERGEKLLFAARFAPGVRAAIFFSAGMLKVPFKHFIIYDGSAALISVPAIIFSAYYFGNHLDDVISYIRQFEYSILLLVALFICYIVLKSFRSKKAVKSLPKKSDV